MFFTDDPILSLLRHRKESPSQACPTPWRKRWERTRQRSLAPGQPQRTHVTFWWFGTMWNAKANWYISQTYMLWNGCFFTDKKQVMDNLKTDNASVWSYFGMAGWWFVFFCFSIRLGIMNNNDPNWLIFFRGVGSTTNQPFRVPLAMTGRGKSAVHLSGLASPQ